MAFPAETLLRRFPIPVRETVGHSPPKPQVIEVTRREQRDWSLYEQEGLAYIERVIPPNRFIVGPALIEQALGNSGHKLPDAMIFRPFNDFYVLEELTEFKSGKALYKSTSKIDGLKELIADLRGNPTKLNDHISRVVGRREIPRLLMPHSDQDIEVHFVSPRLSSERTLPLHETDFRVFYWTFPQKKAAA